jgi:hypothetical protein
MRGGGGKDVGGELETDRAGDVRRVSNQLGHNLFEIAIRKARSRRKAAEELK